MAKYELNRAQKIDVYYWMRLTRTLDDMAMALWKQGRGVGGMFSQRGHEAISVGTGFALRPEDVVAPLHRDLGCYLLRGLTPRRIMANLLARATGVTRGRDANMHGVGDMSLNLVGFISHLPQTVPVALGDQLEIIRHEYPAGSTDRFGTDLVDRTVTTLTYAVGDEIKAVASLFSL